MYQVWKTNLGKFFQSKTHLGFTQDLIQTPWRWSRANWWPQPHLTLLHCLQLFQAQLILLCWLKESDHNRQSVPRRIRAGFDTAGIVSGWHRRGWQSLDLTVTGAVIPPGVETPNIGLSQGWRCLALTGIARDWVPLNIFRCWVGVELVLAGARQGCSSWERTTHSSTPV